MVRCEWWQFWFHLEIKEDPNEASMNDSSKDLVMFLEMERQAQEEVLHTNAVKLDELDGMLDPKEKSIGELIPVGW